MVTNKCLIFVMSNKKKQIMSVLEKLFTNPENYEFRAVMEDGDGVRSIPLEYVNTDEQDEVIGIGLYRTKTNGEQEHIIDVTHDEVKRWNAVFMGFRYKN